MSESKHIILQSTPSNTLQKKSYRSMKYSSQIHHTDVPAFPSRSDVIGGCELGKRGGERFNIKTLRAEVSRGETADRSHFDPAYASGRVNAFPVRRAGPITIQGPVQTDVD